MARVLVHYDINDEAFSNDFRKSIMEQGFHIVSRPGAPVCFRRETNSVYSAEIDLIEDEDLTQLIAELRRAASDAPVGSLILFECPVALGYRHGPTIEQWEIVRR